MDLWIAVLGLIGVTLTAVMAHLPRLTADVRTQERIARDLKLLETPRPGRASEELAKHVDESVLNLLETRESKAREEVANFALGSSLVGFALLLAIAMLPRGENWDLLKLVLIAALLIATLLMLLAYLGMFIRFIRENRMIKRIRTKLKAGFGRQKPSSAGESEGAEDLVAGKL